MKESNDIKVIPTVIIPGNGPVIIKGYFAFRDSTGRVIEKEQEIHICGCGKSSKKPLCDDSHKRR